MGDGKAETLQRQYETRFADSAAYRNSVWKELCATIFSHYISPDAAVLDLGCGWGEFINNIRAGKKYAMDLNPGGGKRLQADVAFIHGDCSMPWPLEPESLDIVFTSNFLEHLPDKSAMEKTLSAAFESLRPAGLLICMCPNIKYVEGAYWDFWDHHLPLTESSVAEILCLHGFRILQKIPRFLPYSMSGKKTPPLLLVRLYLRLPFLWRFFGKQFLIVAEKPGMTVKP